MSIGLLPLLSACVPEQPDTAAEYCDIYCEYDEACPSTAENGWDLYTSDDRSVMYDLQSRARCMFGHPITIELNGQIIEECDELIEGDHEGNLDWEVHFETCESI